MARGLRTKLVDPQTGESVTEPGRFGLLIAGPTVFAGYWRRDDLTTAAFDEEGFFRAGDLFRLEDQAHLRFVGRARDLIVRGGMKIAPEEVEALLADHPKIADVAVVGIADERMEGEQVVTAVVVPKEGDDRARRGPGPPPWKGRRRLQGATQARGRRSAAAQRARQGPEARDPRNRQLGSASRFRGSGTNALVRRTYSA